MKQRRIKQGDVTPRRSVKERIGDMFVVVTYKDTDKVRQVFGIYEIDDSKEMCWTETLGGRGFQVSFGILIDETTLLAIDQACSFNQTFVFDPPKRGT